MHSCSNLSAVHSFQPFTAASSNPFGHAQRFKPFDTLGWFEPVRACLLSLLHPRRPGVAEHAFLRERRRQRWEAQVGAFVKEHH